jgi:hypothetical protein
LSLGPSEVSHGEIEESCLFSRFSKIGEIRKWVLWMAQIPFFTSFEIAPIREMGYTGFLLSPITFNVPPPY